mgnify:CR=1 FL=1
MGIVLVYDRVRLLQAGHDSTAWPTAAGTVVDASAESVAGIRVGPGWRLKVNYVYEVEGRVFDGNLLRFSQRPGSMSRADAEMAISEFEPASSIEVRYDPDQPSRSVLFPGPDGRAWFGLCVGLVLCLIALVFWTVPTRSQQ